MDTTKLILKVTQIIMIGTLLSWPLPIPAQAQALETPHGEEGIGKADRVVLADNGSEPNDANSPLTKERIVTEINRLVPLIIKVGLLFLVILSAGGLILSFKKGSEPTGSEEENDNPSN